MTGPINGFNRPLGSRVLVRVVRYPLDVRGEVLAVYIDSRTMTDPDEVVYSFARGEFRVEPHRRLMQRTRPATDTQTAEAQARMVEIGERVTVLRRGLRSSPSSSKLMMMGQRMRRPLTEIKMTLTTGNGANGYPVCSTSPASGVRRW